MTRLPVLWLTGAPGVGKTTAAFELHTRLGRAAAADGTAPTGYVDIDQLGMCYPVSPDDPERHAMKLRNLAAVLAAMRGSGVRRVVVSGIADPADGPRRHPELLPDIDLTVCLLRADPEELRRRFLGRGRDADGVESALAEAAAMDAAPDFADLVVETAGRTPDQVLAEVAARTDRPPSPAPEAPSRTAPATPAGVPAEVPGGAVPVLWVTGARGVGKSTAGWFVAEELRVPGRTVAFVDLEQLGFCAPAPERDPGRHALKARTLAAVRGEFHRVGADVLVVNGPPARDGALAAYPAALPGVPLTVCRLHAGPDELARRIALRGKGGGPDIPGDDLRGASPEVLRAATAGAVAEAAELADEGVGDFCVDTDGLSQRETARAVLVAYGSIAGS